MYHLYILQCVDGTLYTGITTDLEKRFKKHRSGDGGAYTRSKKVKRILYTEPHKNRSSALKREYEIKQWPRAQKIALIENGKASFTN